jgi:hypothetical protein
MMSEDGYYDETEEQMLVWVLLILNFISLKKQNS